MSLVNAVHTLLEVAAGRLNLTPQAADELHAAIDAEQAPVAPESIAEPEAPATPDPTSVPSSGPSLGTEAQPWQS